MKELIDKLYETNSLSPEELKILIDNRNPEVAEYLFENQALGLKLWI